MIKQQLFIGAALLAGACIGYCLAPEGGKEKAVSVESEKETPVRGKIKDNGTEATVSALRARIKALEEKIALSAAEKSATNGAEEVKTVAEGTDTRGRGANRFREMIEKFKKEDPERFKRISERIENFRRMREESQKAKLDFLSSIDMEGLGEEAKKNHEDLKALIVERQNLEAELMNEDITDERRREIMQELFAMSSRARELNERERSNLLGVVASSVGLEGEAAVELVDTVKDIFEATQDHGGRGRPPRGGSPRR